MPTLCPPGPKPGPKRARKTMIQIGKNPIKLAEREGFEPSVPVTQYARLAIWCLRPLGHLSVLDLRGKAIVQHRSIARKLNRTVARERRAAVKHHEERRARCLKISLPSVTDRSLRSPSIGPSAATAL